MTNALERLRELHEKATKGPLVVRRINDSAQPFAVIDPDGPHGDTIVAGYVSTETYAALIAESRNALPALIQCAEALNAVMAEINEGGESIGSRYCCAQARAALAALTEVPSDDQ